MLRFFRRIIRFKNDCCFLSSFSKMSVDAIFYNIHFSFGEPFNIGILHIKVHYLIPLLVPSKVFFRYFSPEFSRFTNGFIIMFEILFKIVNLIVTHNSSIFIKLFNLCMVTTFKFNNGGKF